MDSYGFIDTIQVEKANAHARYKRYNTIAKIFKVIEVFIAVTLLSWSSSRLPAVFKVSAEYLYAILSYLLNQHVVFLVGNVIVVLCYVFSCHADTQKEFEQVTEEESMLISSSFTKTSDGDSVLYIEDETVSVSALVPCPMEKELPLPSSETEEMDLQTMLENKNEDKQADSHENGIVKTESEVAAEMAIKEAAKRIERFKRTQSEKLKREISVKPKRELRRSVTDRSRRSPNNGCRDSREGLNDKEFQLAIEAFIFKQRIFHVKENIMVED